MLVVGFAPGCYGTYVLSSLCIHTSLITETIEFDFDNNGSSHCFREFYRKHSNNIKLIHTKADLEDTPLNADIIVIRPNQNHILDYINNQYIKNNFSLNGIFSKIFPNANDKMCIGWNYDDVNKAPTWVLREFISFNICSIIKNYTNINKLNNLCAFDANNIFDDFITLFYDIARLLKVNVTTPLIDIKKTHNKFISLQTQHNIQKKCNTWVNDILSNKPTNSPCTTIFDEAYVQSQLRNAGYELKCNELDTFPKTSSNISKLLYKL